ncbi:MAG TPA: hypothetical protein VFZ66_00985 [Herpetosiphonaceae bacterium]
MRHVRVLVLASLMLALTLGWAGYVVAGPIGSHSQGRSQADRGQAENSAAYTSFHKMSDDSGSMSLEVPTAWSEVETGPWIYQGRVVGAFVAASPALDDFYALRKTPGVFMAASHELADSTDVAGLLGLEQRKLTGKCKLKERKAYTDAFYGGLSDAYVACVNGQQDMLVIAATPPERDVLLLIRINRASDADTVAIARIFKTFQVLGIPGHDDHHDHE